MRQPIAVVRVVVNIGAFIDALEHDRHLLQQSTTNNQQSQCEMKRLYVRPDFRHLGIGQALVQKCLDEAVAIGAQLLLACGGADMGWKVAAPLALVSLLLAAVPPASAHTSFTSGPYTIEVGWLSEPAHADQAHHGARRHELAQRD